MFSMSARSSDASLHTAFKCPAVQLLPGWGRTVDVPHEVQAALSVPHAQASTRSRAQLTTCSLAVEPWRATSRAGDGSSHMSSTSSAVQFAPRDSAAHAWHGAPASYGAQLSYMVWAQSVPTPSEGERQSAWRYAASSGLHPASDSSLVAHAAYMHERQPVLRVQGAHAPYAACMHDEEVPSESRRPIGGEEGERRPSEGEA
mmetsp:Transcript_65309/g.129244  ORF Transcript_65309/g.129244 Transcript_65309/m.129244 type:complete len:202 (-) Transcript_65309:1191-1796(-)